MNDSHAARLTARFRDDAQALRARATVLDAQGAARRGGGGPNAAACRAMADACDRVAALFSGASDETLEGVIPELERLLTAERAPDTKHVYEGAIARVRQSLGDADDDDDDEEDEDDEEEDVH